MSQLAISFGTLLLNNYLRAFFNFLLQIPQIIFGLIICHCLVAVLSPKGGEVENETINEQRREPSNLLPVIQLLPILHLDDQNGTSVECPNMFDSTVDC
jgi:hypothetical protein